MFVVVCVCVLCCLFVLWFGFLFVLCGVLCVVFFFSFLLPSNANLFSFGRQHSNTLVDKLHENDTMGIGGAISSFSGWTLVT